MDKCLFKERWFSEIYNISRLRYTLYLSHLRHLKYPHCQKKKRKRKVPSMAKSNIIVTIIAISVNKSVLSVQKKVAFLSKNVPFQPKKRALSVQKKCHFSSKKRPFSPLLSALLKTAPLPFGPSGAVAHSSHFRVCLCEIGPQSTLFGLGTKFLG